jgi:hypothetical protein
MKRPALRYVSLALALTGVLLVGMGLWLSYQHHVLLTDGVEVEATVTHKEAKGRPGQQVFTAQLVPADQPQLSIKVRMTEAQFTAAEDGERVAFTYVASDPETHMIGGLDQARALESRDHWSAIAGVLVLAAAAVVLRIAGRPAKRGKRAGAARGNPGGA